MHFSFLASPNFSQRNYGEISMIVIHHISLPAHQFGGHYIEDFFQNKLDIKAHKSFEDLQEMKVSAHLLIKRTGETCQFVDFAHQAWHAGKSYYAGIQNINECSIGIELEGDNISPFTAKQYQKLEQILVYLTGQYPIKYIVGHSDIAPKRKTDPGVHFKWHKLLNGNILTHYR